VNRRTQSILLAIALSTAASSVTPADAAGRTATSIPNTILNGKGAPSSTDGINGDFYIDTRSLLLFGPKSNGKWPTPQNLQGPTGATGTDGKSGSDGKTISNASISGAVGPAGPQGEKGLPGASGSAGPAGAPGPTGATGPAGATGPQGATGPSGTGSGPTGPTGPQGATGLTGAQGATGATGPQGATGATGAAGATGLTGTQGAAGVVKAVVGTFTIPDVSGIAGTSQSGSINGFKAGKNYLVRIKIMGYQPSDNSEYLLPMSLATSVISGSPTFTATYSLLHGYSYRIGSIRYENSIDVELSLDGSAVVTDFGVTFTVTAGRNTSGAELVRFEASYTALEIQTVTNTF